MLRKCPIDKTPLRRKQGTRNTWKCPQCGLTVTPIWSRKPRLPKYEAQQLTITEKEINEQINNEMLERFR